MVCRVIKIPGSANGNYLGIVDADPSASVGDYWLLRVATGGTKALPHPFLALGMLFIPPMSTASYTYYWSVLTSTGIIREEMGSGES